MVKAMVVHEYESETCKGNRCGYPQAEAYNLVVSVALGGGRRRCIHAVTTTLVDPGSISMELLEGAALLMGNTEPLEKDAELRPVSTGHTHAVLAAMPRNLAVSNGARARASYFGVHKHGALPSGGGCANGMHHSSCDTLFPGQEETSCTLVVDSSPQKWNCVHSDVFTEESPAEEPVL